MPICVLENRLIAAARDLARARPRIKPAAKKSPMAQMNGHVDHADHDECQG